MENQFNSTPIVYTYRYILKDKAGKLYVRYISEPQEAHAMYQKQIVENPNIVSCMREYVNEINFAYLGFTEPVKSEDKEVHDERSFNKD